MYHRQAYPSGDIGHKQFVYNLANANDCDRWEAIQVSYQKEHERHMNAVNEIMKGIDEALALLASRHHVDKPAEEALSDIQKNVVVREAQNRTVAGDDRV